MVAPVRYDVRGVAQLNASLDQLAVDLSKLAPIDAARLIGTAARANAPKRTGRLARSFSPSTDAGVVTVTFGTPYAGPINFGVGPRPGRRGPHNIRATRFLSDAIEDHESAWLNEYAKDAQTQCNQVRGA